MGYIETVGQSELLKFAGVIIKLVADITIALHFQSRGNFFYFDFLDGSNWCDEISRVLCDGNTGTSVNESGTMSGLMGVGLL